MSVPTDHLRVSPIQQACAVPLRANAEGLEVCLITSMGRRRWIFPKGVVDPGETHAITALKEAREEAGIEGTLLEPAVGSYGDFKWNARLAVTVFAMSVDRVYDTWLESGLRRRRWALLEEARSLLTDPALREMLGLAVKRFRGD
ncbi:MAG TPA: NUDIX hydrolase [Pirellulales bacterium]|nr:NUDIX hydrolase [Pirellulales bacterium]